MKEDEQNLNSTNTQKLSDISDNCINFAIWVQDNYSQNKYAGTNIMLPKGKMRKDFTNDIYTMSEIWKHYESI